MFELRPDWSLVIWTVTEAGTGVAETAATRRAMDAAMNFILTIVFERLTKT